MMGMWRARVRSQPADGLPAVHDGHREVGDDDVGDEVAGLLETVLPVLRLCNDVALKLKDERVQLARLRRVVDDQHQGPRADKGLPLPRVPAPALTGTRAGCRRNVQRARAVPASNVFFFFVTQSRADGSSGQTRARRFPGHERR